MRGTVLISLSLILVFAGVPSQGGSGAAVAITDLAIASGDVVELDLQGTGWALVRITAVDDIDVDFALTHDTMEDLCIFSNDGDGIYDQGHVTGFFFREPGASISQWFWWHGIPTWSVWPSQSGECGVSDPISVAAGQSVHFVVADTTGGYTATISADSSGPPTTTVAVPLDAHPRFLRVDPAPTETGVFSAEGVDVLWERQWNVGLTLDEDLVQISDWDHRDGGAHAYVAWEDKTIVAAGSPSEDPIDGLPGWGESFGGQSWGRSTQGYYWDEPGAFDARYTRAEISAAPGAAFEDGAYVVDFPLAP